MLCILEVAPGLLPGPPLAPMAPEPPGLGFEKDFGKAIPCPAGHDFIAGFGDEVQPRGPAVKGKADGIQEGGLACPGGAGDGENPVLDIFRHGKIDNPFPVKGVQVLKSESKDFHNLSLYSAWVSCSWSWVRISWWARTRAGRFSGSTPWASSRRSNTSVTLRLSSSSSASFFWRIRSMTCRFRMRRISMPVPATASSIRSCKSGTRSEPVYSISSQARLPRAL